MPSTSRSSVLSALKSELEAFGRSNDAPGADRSQRMLNVTRDTGEFLSVLIRATGARRILEVGTSNGYSTLWLAEAARAVGGVVTTIERSEYKVRLASANFRRSGLASLIEIVQDDAATVLTRSADGSEDLIFLDADRGDYTRCWPDLRRVLRAGGVLVADNAISHAGEMAAFTACVTADAAFTVTVVPVGKGEFVAVKAPS